jgi:D-methionine transport system ATP-binding protein
VEAPGTARIRLSGVSKVFSTPKKSLTVLDGIDLEVQEGEIYGLIGRSGAGKSTLLRMVNALERPMRP